MSDLYDSLQQPSKAEDFFEAVKTRYEEIQGRAPEDKAVQMSYYCPSGETILIENIQLFRDGGTLLLQGSDRSTEYCEVLVQAENAHIVMRVISLASDVSKSVKKIGFTVRGQQSQE